MTLAEITKKLWGNGFIQFGSIVVRKEHVLSLHGEGDTITVRYVEPRGESLSVKTYTYNTIDKTEHEGLSE